MSIRRHGAASSKDGVASVGVVAEIFHWQNVFQQHAYCGFWWLLLLGGLTSAAVSLAPHLALQRGRLRERVLFRTFGLELRQSRQCEQMSVRRHGAASSRAVLRQSV